jgi:hypothetical protein
MIAAAKTPRAYKERKRAETYVPTVENIAETVTCSSCGRRVKRQARQQRFCSRRCRQKANYVEKVARGDFSTRTIARPTNPPKKRNKFKALQRAKLLSSHPVLAPARVLAIEVFARPWQEAISSAGIAIEVSCIRPRALVVS